MPLTPAELQNMDVLQRLYACTDNLTKAQKLAATYFQEHTMEAAFSTVDKTAHTIGVSTTTVVRLAITLGYSGYAELQGALKDYLTTATAPIHMFSSVMQSEGASAQSGDFESQLELEIQNLRKTCMALSPAAVDGATDTLSKAQRIFVIGGRNSEGPARFFAYNMGRMFLNVQFIPCDVSSMPEHLNSMTSDDVLVYFCFSRYLKATGDATHFAKNIGAKVIGITDSAACPWVPFTDFLFICAKQSANFHHSPLATMFVANILMKQCAQKNPERVEASLQKLEQTAQTLQIFTK